MEAIRSSETSVLIRATRCHLPEDDNHHSHRRGNLKSYIITLWSTQPSVQGSTEPTFASCEVNTVLFYFFLYLIYIYIYIYIWENIVIMEIYVGIIWHIYTFSATLNTNKWISEWRPPVCIRMYMFVSLVSTWTVRWILLIFSIWEYPSQVGAL
jgi:hypothetical protein